jgi:cytochrome c
MMTRFAALGLAAIAATASLAARAASPPNDAELGARLFARACAACHSLAPGENMTGPSLAGIWGRDAGRLKSFERYSPALKAANVAWSAQTLDAWLKSPARFIPNNDMTFGGISDADQRRALIAFLHAQSSGDMPAGAAGQGGGMMGGMTPHFTDLKKVGPDRQVRSIRLCRDSYFVTTADGRTKPFWEPNLRFKTDSSATGPLAGRPAILPAGMMGDRASVFFASPGEISPFIRHQC